MAWGSWAVLQINYCRILDSYFQEVTAYNSWETAVDMLKRKRIFLQKQLQAGNYDVLLNNGELGGQANHFAQHARDVQREMENLHHQIQQGIESAQSVANVTTAVAQHLLPPPSIPLAPDGGGPLLSFLASQMAQGQLPDGFISGLSALQAQLNFNHSHATQISGWQQQSWGQLVTVMANQNAAFAAQTAVNQHHASLVDQSNVLISQLLQATLQLQASLGYARPGIAQAGPSGVNSGQGLPQLPPSAGLNGLSESMAKHGAKRKRDIASLRNRATLIRDSSVEPDTSTLPLPFEEVPEGHTWIIMQHIEGNRVTFKGSHLQFLLEDSWVIPGMILGEDNLQPSVAQWASSKWQGASWDGRKIQVRLSGNICYNIWCLHLNTYLAIT